MKTKPCLLDSGGIESVTPAEAKGEMTFKRLLIMAAAIVLVDAALLAIADIGGEDLTYALLAGLGARATYYTMSNSPTLSKIR